MSDFPFLRPRHPFSLASHPIVWLLLVALLAGAALADEKPAKKKQPLAEQFLVFGTVFDERGFVFQGAEIRMRRASEKKVRWRAYSDRRGEFGIRVPTGEEYELAVVSKGYAEEQRKIDARNGSRQDLVLHLQPAPKGKKK